MAGVALPHDCDILSLSSSRAVHRSGPSGNNRRAWVDGCQYEMLSIASARASSVVTNGSTLDAFGGTHEARFHGLPGRYSGTAGRDAS